MCSVGIYRRSSVDLKEFLKMNHCNLQQNAVVACEELRGLLSVSDLKGPLICPKPRRVGMLANNPNKSLRCYVRYIFFPCIELLCDLNKLCIFPFEIF